MADQLTPTALPAYGNTVAKTPHLDALAADAVIFDSAYCNSPLCAPSRYAFMTGKLPSHIGAYDNAAELPSEAITFAHHLRSAGYRTVLSGKMHFCGADQLHGFEERLTTDIYPADFGWTPDWEQPELRPDWYHNMGSVIDAGACVRTNQLDYDDEVVGAARQKLFDIARDADDRPFCLVVSMTHPHDPYAISAPYWNLYRDDQIDMPRIDANVLPQAQQDPHTQRLRHVIDIDRTPVTPQQIRAARHAYYGAVSYVDEQIGAIRMTLEQTGMADNTIIIVTSDHGDMLGERGLWYKMSFFEHSSRVPLIVSAPQRFAAHRVAQSVSLIDLLPTLVDLSRDRNAPLAATSPYLPDIDGRSLLPHLQQTGGHDGVAAEYLAEGAIAPIVMLRRGVFKFIHSPADPDQLFNLEADPDELRNLADDHAHGATVASFRQEILAGWDLPSLHAQVLASQRRRRFLAATLRIGKSHAWDYQPVQDASRRYIRNHLDLDALEARARLPHLR